MKQLVMRDGRQWVEDRADPAIPDADLWARFRDIPDAGIPNHELRNTLDTRYLQPLLYFWARTIHAATIVEIGAGLGGSFLPLLKAASEMPNGVLYSIDPNHTQQPFAREIAERYGLTDKAVLCEMNSDAFFATIGASLQIDFAFVDGDHTCAAVAQDAGNVLDRLMPGGVAVFHEYDAPTIPPNSELESVPMDFNDPSGCDYGTPRALNAVLVRYDVDVMPLQFGACGIDRVPDWTEVGAIAIRKRLPNEYRVKQ